MQKTRLIGPVMLGALAAGIVGADQTPAAAGPIRICAARNELPYSDAGRRGFENKIAEVVAAELRRPLEFVWAEKDAIYLVRDYLAKGLCDVVMGLDTGDPRVLTTKPYYRSGYVFIYRQDRGLNVQDWNSPDLRKLHRFAIIPGTPAETLLKRIGKFEGNFNYMHSLVDFKSRRNQYVRFDPERLVREVVDGEADIAILWGPLAARYVKRSTVPLTMVLIPDQNVRSDGEKVGHHYNQSFGVRKDDVALLRQLDQALESAATKITAILEAEGMPLLPLKAAVSAASIADRTWAGDP
ncbi:MAG: methanol oxidation system protein MoxJ [Gammaproteobacteria bacterium]